MISQQDDDVEDLYVALQNEEFFDIAFRIFPLLRKIPDRIGGKTSKRLFAAVRRFISPSINGDIIEYYDVLLVRRLVSIIVAFLLRSGKTINEEVKIRIRLAFCKLFKLFELEISEELVELA